VNGKGELEHVFSSSNRALQTYLDLDEYKYKYFMCARVKVPRTQLYNLPS